MLLNGSWTNHVDDPAITSIAKNAYVTPVTNAWSERDGSAIKLIKTNKRSTLIKDTFNGSIMVLVNG